MADLFDIEYLKSNLKRRSLRGGGIALFSAGCKLVLHTGSTVVLARILSPADFGLIAMVTSITGFAMIFSNLGLSTATIQKAEIDQHQVSILFWINAGFGFLIAATLMGLAPAVAWFYGDPRLTGITIALSVLFVFHGFSVQHQAMLERHMKFFSIGIVEISSMTVGVGVAILASFLGAGYWALVLMHLMIAVSTAVGKWIAFPWRPTIPKRGVGVTDMLAMGGNVTGFNILNYFSRSADNILIGKFLGSTPLGLYAKAYSLLMMPITQIRGPLISVGLPALSRLQEDPKLYRNYYLKMVQMLAFASIPMVVLLAENAQQLILLLLGPQWEESAVIFRILSFAGIIQPVSGTVGLVMLSSGHADRYFKMGVFTSIVFVTSFAIGLPWGTSGVALSYTIANYVLLAPTLVYAFKDTPIHIGDFGRAISLPIIAATVMVLGGRTTLYFWNDPGGWVALLIALLAGCTFYFLAYLVLPGGVNMLKNVTANAKLIFKNE